VAASHPLPEGKEEVPLQGPTSYFSLSNSLLSEDSKTELFPHFPLLRMGPGKGCLFSVVCFKFPSCKFRWPRNGPAFLAPPKNNILYGCETLSLTLRKEHRLRMKSILFWGVTPCSLLRCNRRFGGTYRLHLQGRRKFQQEPASKQAASRVRMFENRMLRRIFGPKEDEMV
jgi:hypothetical protein